MAPPVYQVDAALHVAGHTVTGALTIILAPDDPRALTPTLLMHLPPNRFLEEDPRGPRRDLDSLPFARVFGSDLPDPMLPEGFSLGQIQILSVEDLAGRVLSFSLRDNPAIPQGYSTRQGMLRVEATTERPLSGIVVRFSITLPNRFEDGWTSDGLVLDDWLPMLANAGGEREAWDPSAPRAALWQGRISVDQAGWLALGSGKVVHLTAPGGVDLPASSAPAHSLPLVFLNSAEYQEVQAAGNRIQSLAASDGERAARLSLRAAQRFVTFMDATYGLPVPWGTLTVVQVSRPSGDVHTMGHLVLIPRADVLGDPLLDRILVARLARALGRVWFGETVWANVNQEAWLSPGISGYLALDFYRFLYGPDAPVHTVMDWLNPRFREQFYEAPLRELIRGGEDAPLLIPQFDYPHNQAALIVVNQKAPLVIRELEYVMGRADFYQALGNFFREHSYAEAGAEDLEEEANRVSPGSLDWFFDEWFHGTPRINFSIAKWNETPQPNGYLVTVAVRQNGTGRMPTDVAVTDVTGQTRVQRWDGLGGQANLQFFSPAPVSEIRVDPGQYVLELDRKDNQSKADFRVRPFFDWSKQNETLLTIQGTLGGNAIDGNYYGLGADVSLDEDNLVELIPIYGERTQFTNYSLRWTRGHFLLPRLSMDVTASHLGGVDNQTALFTYRYITPDWISLNNTLNLGLTRVDAVNQVIGDKTFVQPPGNANDAGIGGGMTLHWNLHLSTDVNLSADHSEPSYNSNYTYTQYSLGLGQHFAYSRHSLDIGLTRQSTDGEAPVQRLFLLGGPQQLRGYPRTLALVSEQLESARLDFSSVLARGVVGGALQFRQLSVIVFGDVGRGWNNDQSPEQVRQRQDVGVGVEVRVNLLHVLELPLRVDVAVPFNDPQYSQRQIVLLQTLSFF